MKLISQCLVGRAVGPSSGLAEYIIHAWNYYQTVNAVSSSCVTLKIFLGLGLTVSEINIKKVQKQDLNIKNVKRCRDGMPKSMRSRDDIIVRVSLQSPIATSFYITVVKTIEG